MNNKKDVDILKRIEELLDYYKEMEQELWMLMRKYENTSLLDMQYQRIVGKIEVLKELKEVLKEK